MVDVIYEDNHLLVCIKPQNIPTQKDITNDLDMLTMAKNYLKDKYQKPGNVFVGLLHRLDRPTGGVIVFAKTSKCAKRLSEQIKNKEFKKNYLCVVNGVPKNTAMTLENYLKKDDVHNKVSIVSKYTKDSKKAELQYEVLDTYKNNLALLNVNLLTGRSHQIRVQMSGIKNPLFGDIKYGAKNIPNANLALWAYKLSFLHPITNNKMTFTVCPPLDNLPWKYFEKSIKNICK